MKRQQDKLLIIIAMSGEMPTYLGQYVTGSISYSLVPDIPEETLWGGLALNEKKWICKI